MNPIPSFGCAAAVHEELAGVPTARFGEHVAPPSPRVRRRRHPGFPCNSELVALSKQIQFGHKTFSTLSSSLEFVCAPNRAVALAQAPHEIVTAIATPAPVMSLAQGKALQVRVQAG